MRTKDSYQEHMLGYLVGVQSEIERLERIPHITRSDLFELYDDLDAALERLWWIINSNDMEWESLRHNLEGRCDDLLRDYYQVLRYSRIVKRRWVLE